MSLTVPVLCILCISLICPSPVDATINRRSLLRFFSAPPCPEDSSVEMSPGPSPSPTVVFVDSEPSPSPSMVSMGPSPSPSVAPRMEGASPSPSVAPRMPGASPPPPVVNASDVMPEESTCRPEPAWWRPGSTYNDPTMLITDTDIECCEICREEERCLTWSRERSSGACALKDTNATAFEDDRYDSGFIGGVDASEVVPLDACFMERGVAYPNGVTLMETQTQSVEECCELCRGNVECFSWHGHQETGRCTLNSNVPPSESRGMNFFGASMI